MRREVQRYMAGLVPVLSPNLLEEETVSRLADFREDVEDILDQLTPEELDQVRLADRELINQAGRVASFWREDQTAEDRLVLFMPLAHWWWWLDKIADGTYPRELLPELASS